MTLDFHVEFSSLYKETQGRLELESNSLSEVTWGYFPSTPSIIDDHLQ